MDRVTSRPCGTVLRAVGGAVGRRPTFGGVALVVPVVCADGHPAALKLQPVDDETGGEGVALHCWAGLGAVWLLEHDPETRSMLLERRSYPTGEVRAALLRRFDLMTERLELDRGRAAAWTVGRVLQNAVWDLTSFRETRITPVHRTIADTLVGTRPQ